MNKIITYIKSFSKPKKAIFIIQIIFIIIEIGSPICYLLSLTPIGELINNNIIYNIFVLTFASSLFCNVYLFIFPIIFLIANFFILKYRKYNVVSIIINTILQIVNPSTILLILWIYVGISDSIYPM